MKRIDFFLYSLVAAVLVSGAVFYFVLPDERGDAGNSACSAERLIACADASEPECSKCGGDLPKGNKHDHGGGNASLPEKVKDPVCGMTVETKDAKNTADVDGKRYFFCSEDCKTKFLKDPSKFKKEK